MPSPARRILFKVILLVLVAGGAVYLYLHKPSASDEDEGDGGPGAAPEVTVKVAQVSRERCAGTSKLWPSSTRRPRGRGGRRVRPVSPLR